MNTPQSQSHDPNTLPAEAAAMAAELAELPAQEAALARQALTQLAKEEAPPAEEIPPLPDHLKDRWREKFGRSERRSQVQAAEGGFFANIGSWLFGSGVAKFGLAAACVAFGLLASKGLWSPQEKAMTEPAPVVVRTAQKVEGERPVVLIANDGGKAFAAHWTGKPQVVGTVAEAEVAAATLAEAVVVNSIERKVSLWSKGKVTKEIPVEDLSSEPLANLSAALVEALNAQP
jgi:hypothetical protein